MFAVVLTRASAALAASAAGAAAALVPFGVRLDAAGHDHLPAAEAPEQPNESRAALRAQRSEAAAWALAMAGGLVRGRGGGEAEQGLGDGQRGVGEREGRCWVSPAPVTCRGRGSLDGAARTWRRS